MKPKYGGRSIQRLGEAMHGEVGQRQQRKPRFNDARCEFVNVVGGGNCLCGNERFLNQDKSVRLNPFTFWHLHSS